MQLHPHLIETTAAPGEWLAELPALVSSCCDKWGLTLEKPWASPHAFVCPAGDVVLKIISPAVREADFEVEGLQLWEGAGAVRVLHSEPSIRAYVMERCRPGKDLYASDVDANDVFIELVSRLDRTAPVSCTLPRLRDEAARWSTLLDERTAQLALPLPHSLVDRARETYDSVDRASNHLVNQDLHGVNVLSSQRDSWLMIDPMPLVGEREFMASGILRNAAWMHGAAGVTRALDALTHAGLDRARMREWSLAHAIAWGWSNSGKWQLKMMQAAEAIANA